MCCWGSMMIAMAAGKQACGKRMSIGNQNGASFLGMALFCFEWFLLEIGAVRSVVV